MGSSSVSPGSRFEFRDLDQLFLRYSGDAAQALHQAQGLLYGMLQEQASVLAFESVYRILAVAVIAVLPVLFLLRR